MKKIIIKQLFNAVRLLSLGFLAFYAADALAAAPSGPGLGSIADNVKDTFGSVAELITAASYVAGLGFGVGAILKFKAHKDNPTQIPIGTPIALLFVAAALIFLPNIFSASGKSLFGEGASIAGVEGKTTFGGLSGGGQ